MFIAFYLHPWVPIDLFAFIGHFCVDLSGKNVFAMFRKGIDFVMLAIYTRKAAVVAVSEGLKYKIRALKEGM